jgi:hypothetical protein
MIDFSSLVETFGRSESQMSPLSPFFSGLGDVLLHVRVG